MATYIVLGQFTDQGIKNVMDTTKRAEALEEMGRTSTARVLGLGDAGHSRTRSVGKTAT